MKLSVYKTKEVVASSKDNYEDLCDLFNLPSLRYGYVEVLGEFSHYITKSELKKMQKVSQRYYDESINDFVDGLLILNFSEKLFVKF